MQDMAYRRFPTFEPENLNFERSRNSRFENSRDPGFGRLRESRFEGSRDSRFENSRDLGFERPRRRRSRDSETDMPRRRRLSTPRDRDNRSWDRDYWGGDRDRDRDRDRGRDRDNRGRDRNSDKSKRRPESESRKTRSLVRKDKQGQTRPKSGIRSLKGRSKSVDKGTRDLLRFFKNRVNVPTIRIRDDARFIIYMSQFRDFFSWQLVVSLLIILMGGIGSLTIHAHVTSLESQINIARNDLSQAHQDVFTLEARLDDRYDMLEVQWIAIDRLGMSFPDPSQIIEINVPRQGGATLNTIMREEPVENYLWNDITSFFRGIIETVFGGAQ